MESGSSFGMNEKEIDKKQIKKEQGNPLINHQATMAHLISLLLISFEITSGRNKIGKSA